MIVHGYVALHRLDGTMNNSTLSVRTHLCVRLLSPSLKILGRETAGGLNSCNADSEVTFGPGAVCCGPHSAMSRAQPWQVSTCVGRAWHLSTTRQWSPQRPKYLRNNDAKAATAY